MKSVIVQGTTVAKAIDEALVKAGMPIEFFIKVLEEAQPGFLGFGSKKAKIALFFKKEQGKREGSLLSRGSYKSLFENEKLQALCVDQNQQDKPAEKKDVATTVAPQPKKVESQQPQQRKHTQQALEPRPQQLQSRKIETQVKKTENNTPLQKTEIKKSVEQKIVQRPLGQRPLKFNKPKQQEESSVLPSIEAALEQVNLIKIIEPLQKDELQVEASANKRPRRRRRYGYRSKAPVQWGKGQDSTDQQSDDERHDS